MPTPQIHFFSHGFKRAISNLQNTYDANQGCEHSLPLSHRFFKKHGWARARLARCTSHHRNHVWCGFSPGTPVFFPHESIVIGTCFGGDLPFWQSLINDVCGFTLKNLENMPNHGQDHGRY